MKAMLEIGAPPVAAEPKTKFRLVDIPQPGEKTSGWDIASCCSQGMDADALKAFIRTLRKLAEMPKSKSTQQPLR